MTMKILLLLSTVLPTCLAAGGSFTAGEVPQKPVVLTTDTFESAIQDPANPFWLLKFFAPWCGHCKKLVPVLDRVAPQTSGKMAFGMIDCTTEKDLCSKHKVRGYPTLKYALDGDIHDYPGGRSDSDFLSFADKMRKPIVENVDSVEAAQKYALEETGEGVAFLAYHPAVVASDEDPLQSTHLTQVYSQLARQERALGSFLLLDTSATEDDESAAAIAGQMGQEGAFICRIEKDVKPRCLNKSMEKFRLSDLNKWYQEENRATVAALGAPNFHKIGRSGRPLCIAILSSTTGDQVDSAKKDLARYAVSGPNADKYHYGYFDGIQWKKFLKQFEVSPNELPQLLVLDVPRKTYWQNKTFGMDVDEFLAAVQDGRIEKKSAGEKGVKGALQDVAMWIFMNQPWSLILIGVIFLAIVVMIVRCCIKATKALRPPYKKKEAIERKSSKVQFDERKAEKVEDKKEK